MSSAEFFKVAPVKMTDPELTADLERLLSADRPEWEDDEPRSDHGEDEDDRSDRNDDRPEAPPEYASPSNPEGETFEQWLSRQPAPPPPRDFEPHPIEPPYRQRRLSWPYVSRERYRPNPNNLGKKELEALERFFETRQM